MELKHEVFRRFPNQWFVETGTYAGDGVQAALDAGFPHVISMDVDEANYNRALERFKDDPRVELHLADSAIKLYDIIKNIKEPITFWLDAHWSGEGSPQGIVPIPLLYELSQIKKHPIPTHTILIDDMRCWRGITHIRDFEEEHLLVMINSINGWYKIEYADGTESNDVLIAHV
jgi:hypothetical protein